MSAPSQSVICDAIRKRHGAELKEYLDGLSAEALVFVMEGLVMGANMAGELRGMVRVLTAGKQVAEKPSC